MTLTILTLLLRNGVLLLDIIGTAISQYEMIPEYKQGSSFSKELVCYHFDAC
ncbi:MAG: hypothetical protein JWM14_850 [Chitinophagaceae bacterium]|nr:hypothetical protein [Chitinophagaceae bacterium]